MLWDESRGSDWHGADRMSSRESELAVNHDLCLQSGATGVYERSGAKPAVSSAAD